MAAINQPGCQRIAIADTNNSLVHIYPLTNCQLGTEVQSLSLNFATEIASSNTCLNAQTFPIANSFFVAISPLSACNLVAFPGSNPQQSGSFIFKRVPCGTLVVNLCCQNKTASEGNTVIKITITNIGSVPLTDIVINDLLPSCFTFKKGMGIDWTFVPGNPVVATFTRTLQAGQSTRVKLCAKANCDDGNVINQVTITSPFTALQKASCLIKI